MQAWQGSPVAATLAPCNSVEDEYEVEQILDHQDEGSGSGCRRKERRYLVLWKGHPVEDATWEPQANLKQSSALVKRYWTTRRLQASSLTTAAEI